MTDERRRELWQKKLDAMPDDMVISEYHRRLARRKWDKAKNEPLRAKIEIALEPQHQGEPDADLKARLDAIFGA